VDQSARGFGGNFGRVNAIIAAVATLISFIIYRATVAPTLSFWDCGEFIACAHSLGVPHPPGFPLFILIARLFDLLPIGSDVAYRINLLSVVSSAFAALFAYLIIVRLVSSWYPASDNGRSSQIISYASGFIGALFMAFSQTNWNNAVEAEVYGLSMMLLLAIFWLGLKWHEHGYSPAGQRIVLLVSFLAMLSIGVHMTVFLVVPIVAIFFSLKETTTKSEWGMVAGFFALELFLIIVLSGKFVHYKFFLVFTCILFAILVVVIRKKIYWPILLSFAAISPVMVGFYPFLFAVIGWLVIAFLIWFVKRENLWRLAWLIILTGIAGYSVHTYIPIRSAHHPTLDMNSPSRSFTTFVDYLDRKQYGSMSMTERMFVRRGSWQNQFGDHARMGFWRFFKEQYSNKKIFPIFLIIGLFGLAILAYKNPAWGFIFLIFVLIASAGLVLYMNFADGTCFNKTTGDAYQEVRDRDYFFTPAYILFGMAIGIGMGGIMELIRKSTEKFRANTNRLAVACSLILVLTPIIPAMANYFGNDRSRNYMPYIYAHNLLKSCDENAILFTSGDNDTYPLWCVQEIYNFRRDVRVVNFSLLNTDWYCWQLKNFQDVPISLSDDQILWEPYTIPDGQVIAKPKKPFFDRTRNRQAWLIPLPYEGKLLKVASMMLDEIILTNKWKYPIYFSSASGEVRNSPLKLLDRCYRQGMILKLSRDEARLSYLEDITDSLFFKIYRYDNLGDTTVAQNENATGIALSYPEKMLDYCQYLQRRGDSAKADSALNKASEAVPTYWRSRLHQRDAALLRGDSARAQEIKDEILAYLHGFLNNNPSNIFFHQFLGTAYYTLGEKDKALEHLEKAWEMNIDKEQTFRALLVLYAEKRSAADMVRIARDYKMYHDEDPVANDIIRSAQLVMQQELNNLKQNIPPQLPSRPPPHITPVPPETGSGGN
jgi:tetratricopeptide (TPR) repeat protein